MNNIDRLVQLGIPYVVAEIFVQQAQRMHRVAVMVGGIVPASFGTQVGLVSASQLPAPNRQK